MTTVTAKSDQGNKPRWLATQLARVPTSAILLISLVLRISFFLFGLYQDKNMPIPYTDIDYYVFTDAAKFVAINQSPFLRATYRYTPLLAWVLVPTTYSTHQLWFSFGKFIFIICDLVTGYISMISLPSDYKYLSTIWLFNPMVITISTRGSSESLLTSFVLLTAYVLIRNNGKKLTDIIISGSLLGVCVHLKIYPFIYTPAFLLYLDANQPLYAPITQKRLLFGASALASFAGLTYWMYCIYGWEYLDEAYFYHIIRLDHRHNFSIYNISLYLNSATTESGVGIFQFEKWAFVSQLALTLIIIPLSLKQGLQFEEKNFRDNILYKTMFIQTFVFIMLNKVCTSQYFIWFLCLLPQILIGTTIGGRKGLVVLLGWVLTQGLWLFNGWRLEFCGKAGIFISGLFVSSSLFFLWNTYMACVFIQDVQQQIRLQRRDLDHRKNI